MAKVHVSDKGDGEKKGENKTMEIVGESGKKKNKTHMISPIVTPIHRPCNFQPSPKAVPKLTGSATT